MAYAWVKSKQWLQRRPRLTSEFFVSQRSMGMSYLDTNQLQMRTVQTEAVAVHRMRAGKKNQWTNVWISQPRQRKFLGLAFIFFDSNYIKKKEKLYVELIISSENLSLMVCCKAGCEEVYRFTWKSTSSFWALKQFNTAKTTPVYWVFNCTYAFKVLPKGWWGSCASQDGISAPLSVCQSVLNC